MYAWESARCPACDRVCRDRLDDRPCSACGCPPFASVQFISFSRPGRAVLTIVGVLLCAGALTGRDWGRWTPPTLLALGILVLVTCWVVLHGPRRAALWADGFALLEGANVVFRASIADVASLRVNESAQAVVIVLRDESVAEIPLVFFASRAAADRFVETLTRALSAE